MPFGSGFDFLDFNTYTWMEYAILGAAILILLIIIVLLFSKPKHKKGQSLSSGANRGGKLTFKSYDEATLIFKDGYVWYVKTDGSAEYYRLFDGKADLVGPVVYSSKETRKVTVAEVNGEVVKESSVNRNYITFDFKSKNEVHLGNKVFLTLEEVKTREAAALEKQRLAEKAAKKAAKLQAKNDAKAEKVRLKLERKAQKKLTKTNAKVDAGDAK